MFSRTKCTYADLFGRCPKSLVRCPVATQGTECFVVDRKTRPQSHCAKEALPAETNSFSRTPIYFEYLVRLSDRCFVDGNHVTAQANWHCETNISYGLYPKSSTYCKQFQAGEKNLLYLNRVIPCSKGWAFVDQILWWIFALVLSLVSMFIFSESIHDPGEGWARKERGSQAVLFLHIAF